MLDLNNCEAASVDHSSHDMSNWLETSENAKRKHFPNHFPAEHEKRWLCKNYSWRSMAV